MSSIDDPSVLINQFIAASASDGDHSIFSKELAALISTKAVSFLQFIQALGPTLTSESAGTRTHSMHCLASMLFELHEAPSLSMQDVSVLSQFVLAKLEDEKLTIHVLNALASLVKFKNYKPNVNNNIGELLEKLRKHYEPRKYLAKVRFESFNLLNAIFTKHVDFLVANAAHTESFVLSFIHVASGEKDPRNLLTSFRLNRAINEKLVFEDRSCNAKHEQLLADLFDVCFCYFPISFTPPANDPYKITSKELKHELRATIASQSQFAQDTFPSLFEKLTSTNPAVRNDVLQCLCLCIDRYSPQTLEQYWLSIWDALKFEILHNDVSIFRPETSFIIPPGADSLDDTDEKKILIYTLKALNSLSARLTEIESVESVESFESFSSTIIDELKPHFIALNEKTARHSVLLLCVMSSSSKKFYNKVVNTLFSFECWGKYVRSDTQDEETPEEIDVSLTVTRQRDLIDLLGFVVTASKLVGEPTNLWEFKDHLLIFMGQLLQTSSNLEKTLKCKATSQLTKMSLLEGFLTREDVNLILNWLGENISSIIMSSNSEWQDDILMQAIIKSLILLMTEGSGDLLQSNVDSVIEIILPMLLQRVHEKGVLALINSLCVNYQVLEVLSIRYLNKLAFDEYDADVFGDIIESLTNSFVKTQAIKPFLTNSWYQSFVPRFLNIILKRAGNDPVILELAGQLFGCVVRFIEKSKHQAILEEYVSVFLDNKTVHGVSAESILDTPSEKVTLFKHLISKIDKNTEFSNTPLVLIEKFIGCAGSSKSNFIRLGYLQVIAILINKFTSLNDESVSEIFTREFQSGATDSASLEVAIWILKGLIVRLDPMGMRLLEILAAQLTNSDELAYCKAISSSFTILMSDLDIFTNRENTKTRIVSNVVNLNVRLLYKQQIFESLFQTLLKNFASVPDTNKKEINLTTLAVIINNVSSEILKPHLKEILPLVLNGLTISNTQVLEASLQTFNVIIRDCPQLIQENLSSLLSKLVFLSTNKLLSDKKLVNTEKIRLMSLDCISGVFTNIEFTKLVRYQNDVRSGLARALDDNKRSVRKKTTDVRQILYELGR